MLAGMRPERCSLIRRPFARLSRARHCCGRAPGRTNQAPESDVEVVGLDPDRGPSRARAARLGALRSRSSSIKGFQMSCPTRKILRSVSRLSCFTHLNSAEKESTLREVRRVLKPGGRFTCLIRNAGFNPRWPAHPLSALESSPERQRRRAHSRSPTPDRSIRPRRVADRLCSLAHRLYQASVAEL